MVTKIEGACALHCIITPNCVKLHGDNGMGAFDEAVRRLRETYKQCFEGWQSQGKLPEFHIALTVDRNKMIEVEKKDA